MMLRPLFLCLFLVGLTGGTAQAMDKLWVALYLGENKPPDILDTYAPEQLTHRLHEVFGFRRYKLLKGEDVNLQNNWDHWVLSRKDFFLRIQPVTQPPDEPPRIDYEIYKDGFIIAKGRYEPSEDTPLFINGPDLHQGRLIFVVEPR